MDIPDDRIDGLGLRGKTLAQIEGPSYEKEPIKVTCDGQAVEAVTFRVIDAKKISGKAPSPEYVRHIIKGLRSFGVPESYVDHVIDVSVANITAADSKPKDARADVEAMRLNSLKAALTLFNEKADRLEARSFTNKIANSGVTLSGSEVWTSQIWE